jgi:FecR protein
LRLLSLLSCVCAGFLAVLANAAPAAPAAPFGTVTLLEGSGEFLRATSRYSLEEGVKLEPGDVIELADKSLLQIEFGSGAILALGPKSRLLSFPPAAKKPTNEFFVLQGTLKVVVPKSDTEGLRFITPHVSLSIVDATALISTSADQSAVFMERGEARAREEGGAGAGANLTLIKSGEYYSRAVNEKANVTARPPQGFIAGLPRAFLDALPSLGAKFKDSDAVPKKTTDFTYAEVEAWLKSTLAVRKVLVPRWRSKARDPAFRSALATNIKDHPEWDRILYPEKYIPKTRPVEPPRYN